MRRLLSEFANSLCVMAFTLLTYAELNLTKLKPA